MITSLTIQLNDFVKVEFCRGVTPGIAQVIGLNASSSGEEAKIRYISNGEQTSFYTCHLYKDMETARMTQEWKANRAATIGTRRR